MQSNKHSRRGSGYMMRSEKRTNGKRARRRRASGVYLFFTLLLSLILWPIGMVMLWRRKVRWGALTKLLVSAVTLFCAIMLVGMALTIPTGNPDITKAQDTVNDFLDDSAQVVGRGYLALTNGAVDVWNTTTDLVEAASRSAMVMTADSLEQTSQALYAARDKVTATETPSEAPTAEPTEAPTEAPTVKPTANPTAKPTEAPTEASEATKLPEVGADETKQPATETPTEAPTEAAAEATTPSPTSRVRAQGTLGTHTTPAVTEKAEEAEALRAKSVTETETPTEAPTDTPTEAPTEEPTPESTEAPTEAPTPEPTEVPTSGPTEAPTPEPTEVPTPEPTEVPTPEPTEVPTPEPTEAPTPEPTATPTPRPTLDPDLTPKPVSEGDVIYFNGGKAYHYADCTEVQGADHHTLADALAAGKHACGLCKAPDPSVINLKNAVWTDQAGVFHMSDDCARFAGCWSVSTLEGAVSNGFTACPDCRADEYAAGMLGLDITVSEPTEAAVEPAATTGFTAVDPDLAPKSAGEAIVYYYDSSMCYHFASSCKAMPDGADPHTLSAAVADGKRGCGDCHTPDASILNESQVVWTDEGGHFHLTDECAAFEGMWNLMTLKDAVDQGYEPCGDCRADRYAAQNGY